MQNGGYTHFALRRRLNQVLVFFNTCFDFVISKKLISEHCPILNLAAIPFFCKVP